MGAVRRPGQPAGARVAGPGLETGDTVALLCGNRREFFEVMLAGMHTGLVKAPKTIDFEERLPRSPTGKLHKRLLRAPYWQGTGRRI